MPVKQKSRQPFHKGHHKEKHTKRFVKVYAPYLPLLIIVGFGLFLSTVSDYKKIRTGVLSYATNVSDEGLVAASNKERLADGKAELRINATLDTAAQAKADDMAKRNYWSHQTPDGEEPWAFVEKAGYGYIKAAENLAYGFDSSSGAVAGWMNSPSHKANLLDPNLKEVGFGIANIPNYQGRGPQTVIVAMYGTPPITTIVPSEQNNPASAGAVRSSNEQKQISYAQAITGGSVPWIGFATGLSIGLIAMYLGIKYAHRLHRVSKRGERFILHHPLLDTTLVALLALAAIVSQTAGTIH